MKTRGILTHRIIPSLLACLVLTSCTIGITNVETLTKVVPETSVSPLSTSVPVLTTTPTPTETGRIEWVGQLLPSATDISVQGNLAYVSDDTLLTIMDVSDPIHPEIVSQTSLDRRIVQVIDDHAYATTQGFCQGLACQETLHVLDVSDPHNLVRVGDYFLSAPGIPYVHIMKTVGNVLYIPDIGIGLRVLDISDPNTLTEINLHKGLAWDVATVSDYAYVLYSGDDQSRSQDQVYYQVLDISNPIAPVEIGSHDMGTFDAGGIPRVTIANGYAYFAVEKRLDIVDVSDPAAPFKVGSFVPRKDQESGEIMNLAVADGYAYMICTYGLGHVLQIVNVSDPASPYEVSSYNFQWPAWDLTVVDGVIYVVSHDVDATNKEGGLFALRYTKSQ